jgi:hypothetical protein
VSSESHSTRRRGRRGRRLLLGVCVVAALAFPAAASAYDVVYWQNLLAPQQHTTNNVLGWKTYNEIFVTNNTECCLGLGVYMKLGDGTKIKIKNGHGWVYVGPHEREFARAYCWNRSEIYTFNARCLYRHP